MSTLLFHEVIFGPVYSRRLGHSLGINLLPTGYKICNFNCIYCECGLSYEKYQQRPSFPTLSEVEERLSKRLKELKTYAQPVDSITFAGNGEPTLHPDFPQVMESVIRLRNEHYPEAIVSVLTNAGRIDRKEIREALYKADKAILKLDAGTEDMFRKINCNNEGISFDKIVQNLKLFGSSMILQTMFVRGVVNNDYIDNTQPSEVEAWLKIVAEIRPSSVMLYSIARETPYSGLEKVPQHELAAIAEKVEKLGIKASVY